MKTKRVRYNGKYGSVIEDVTKKEYELLEKDKSVKKLVVIGE